MRNFWIKTYVDGRATPLKSGPHSKDGGFTTIVKMLVDGGIEQPLRIEGSVDTNGRLILEVYDEWEKRTFRFVGGR